MKKVNEQMNWCGVELQNRLMLAPMAGFTEINYRKIAEDYGVALTCTELVSARGIRYDSEFQKNHRYLNITGLKRPAAIQLFGDDPDDMEFAISRLLEHPLYRECALIDLNMGCPVDKVVKTGAGAALMKDSARACRLTEKAAEAAARYGRQISVKIRSGWDADRINAPEFALALERAGAAAITLHARTREQFYSGAADYDVIAETASRLHVPLAANGDLSSIAQCETVLNNCGASACMIGRAANGNPFIFSQLLGEEKYIDPDGEEYFKVIRRHLEGLIRELGEHTAIREFRTPLSAYLKGKPGAASMRRELMMIDQAELLLPKLEKWFLGKNQDFC